MGEVLVGACLVAGLWRQRLLWAAIALCGAFVSWVVALWLMDARVPCGCGVSRLSGMTGDSRATSLAISGTMLLLCVLSITLGRRPLLETSGSRHGVADA